MAEEEDRRAGFSEAIWQAFEAEEYERAEGMLRARLLDEPHEHWLLTRLGLSLYEQRRYDEAVACGEEAFALAPRCPLVIWDLAGAYQMLGRHDDAIRLYSLLIRQGPERIAEDGCGEGIRAARGLVADSHLRVSDSFAELGKPIAARNAIAKHLACRGPGCRSMYSLREARARQQQLD